MSRALVLVRAATLVLVLALAGCAPAAPAAAPTQPSPTAAPAATTAPAAKPTTPPASAAQPTTPPPPAAPASTAAPAPAAAASDFPQKGKPISIIVPFAAGGGSDLAARLVAPLLEKDLGTPVQVVNRPGASTQVGLTELVRAAPDGHTLALVVLPTAITTYIDADRQAIYTRKDFRSLGSLYVNPFVLSVASGSPYKSVEELVSAAKAAPGKVTLGTTGLLGTNHLVGLQLEKAADARFAYIHFDGSAPMITALLGGHIDATTSLIPDILSHSKAGTVRPLGLADRAPSPFLPGVMPFDYKVPAYFSAAGALVAPAGVPDRIAQQLAASVQKAVGSEEFKKWASDTGYQAPYLGSQEFERLWAAMEDEVRPLMQASTP